MPSSVLRSRVSRTPRARLYAALWSLLVLAVLWLPGGDGPPRWPLAELLAAVAAAGGDKVIHAGLFAVQAWLLCRCRRPRSRDRRWAIGCFVLAAGYGGLTEIGQLAIDGRSAEVADALADAAGAGIGAGLASRRRDDRSS